MYSNYVAITTGNPLTVLDSAAKNNIGAIYSPPPSSSFVFSTTAGASTVGYGAQPVWKYLYFYDANALTGTMQAAQAPVYYIDESFTTVTGNAADAFYTTSGACIAGYLGPNTTALGTSQTGAQWYASLSQSYVWVQVAGLLQGAYAPTTTTAAGVGNYIYGATTGSWTSIVNSSVVGRVMGVQWSAIASSACDVLVGGYTTFWGS